MKTSHLEKRWYYWTVAIAAIALMATACGKKDEGQVVAAPPGPIGASCVGCPTSTALLSSGVGKAYYSGALEAEVSMQFYGTQSAITALQQQGLTPNLSNYNGQFVAGGVLRVRQARTIGCVIPAGDYVLSTVQPGNWQGQSFWGLGLQATGPTTLQIQFPNNWVMSAVPAVVDLAGAQFPFRVQNYATVTSAAGGGCQQPFNYFIFE